MARRLRLVLLHLVVAAMVISLAPAWAASEAELRLFATKAGLVDIAGFVETVQNLTAGHRLPARYATKAQASALRWRPGTDLCQVAPGRVIGGDIFANRERRLPVLPVGRYREADLDYACGDRGTHRLIYAGSGPLYVTVDHYRTFQPVPP